MVCLKTAIGISRRGRVVVLSLVTRRHRLLEQDVCRISCCTNRSTQEGNRNDQTDESFHAPHHIRGNCEAMKAVLSEFANGLDRPAFAFRNENLRSATERLINT